MLTAVQDTPAFVRAALDAVARIDGAVARVRLHPGDDRAAVQAALREAGAASGTLTSGGSLADLVLAADVVVAQVSTVVAESILLDRPTLVVDMHGRGGYEDYARAGASEPVTDLADLPEMLRRALDDDAMRARMADGRADYVRAHFLAADGRSAERVAAVVGEVAGAP